jgi:predicted TPR repeat methyltransferase
VIGSGTLIRAILGDSIGAPTIDHLMVSLFSLAAKDRPMNARDPLKPVLFDAYSDHYEQLVNESLAFSKLKVDFFIRVKAEYMQDILTAHFGDSSKVRLLDIGCGLGKYHPYWVNRVGLLQGVDVSAESIQRAAERNPTLPTRFTTAIDYPLLTIHLMR